MNDLNKRESKPLEVAKVLELTSMEDSEPKIRLGGKCALEPNVKVKGETLVLE